MRMTCEMHVNASLLLQSYQINDNINLEKSVAAGSGRFCYVGSRWMSHRGEFLSRLRTLGGGKVHAAKHHRNARRCLAGRDLLLGQPVHAMKAKQRNELHKANIGFVFQSYHLIDDLTVFENLDLPLSYKNVPHKERVSLVCDTLDRFQIVGKKDLYPGQLSGGQQQLVAVARALIQKPKLILADEPTGNLHSAQGQEIMDLFKRLNDWAQPSSR